MSDTKLHDLTIKYLDANYDLTGKSIDEYIFQYESTYAEIKDSYKEIKLRLHGNSMKVLK